MLAASRSGFFVSTWSGAPAWANAIIIISVVLGSLGLIWRFVWSKVIKPAVKASEVIPPLTKLAEVAPQLQAVAQIANSLEKIAAQFENNGGSTMRDAVDSIRQSVVRIEGTVADHTAAIHTLTTSAQRQMVHADLTKASLANLAPHEPPASES